MSKVNFTLSVSLNEAKNGIKAVGAHITPIIIGQPGIGKSSILKMLEAEMGSDYDYIYVDCPVKDMMDIAASIPNHTTKSLEYYVSTLFKLNNGKKKVIMLDEFMKAPKLLQIIFTRLILERTVGDVALPEGSIVFGTSNNVTDGVGDAMLGHSSNRVCKIHVRNPNAEEFNTWAGNNGIVRPIRAWAAMNPKAFHSYLDEGQEDNPYIFKPSSTQQCVTPRSLAKSSPIVSAKDELGEHLMMAMLAGTIGEAAAKAMAAFIALESKLISFKEIIKSPDTVKVPSEVSAQVMMMFEAVDSVASQDELSKYMEFVNRIPSSEVQSIFFTMIMRGKPRLARYNEQINKWAQENYVLM